MGVYAPTPLEAKLGDMEELLYFPVKRADYIAKATVRRYFPWRIVVSVIRKELR